MVFLVANGGNFEQITALQRLPPHPGGMHVRLEFAVDSYAVRLSPAESAPVSHAKQASDLLFPRMTIMRSPGDRALMRGVVQLLATGGLVFSLAVAATAVSIGIARAQASGVASEPDASLIVAMFAIAIAAMGVLSAAAVKLAGRPRR
jgi:hypothetical protein